MAKEVTTQLVLAQGPKEFTNFITHNEEAFKRFLPSVISPMRFAQLVSAAMTKVPLIKECDIYSVIKAALDSVTLNLEFNTPLQHAALVPYWNGTRGVREAQFQVMYQGLAELGMRSGKIDAYRMDCVFEGDEFDYNAGTGVAIKHQYGDKYDTDPALITHAYAIAWIKGSAIPNYVVLPRASIDRIMKKSASARSKKSSPWETDYAAMAKKTAFKQLAKLIPKTRELATAIYLDDMGTIGQSQLQPGTGADISGLIDLGEQTTPETKTDQLADKLKNKTETKKAADAAEKKQPEPPEDPPPPEEPHQTHTPAKVAPTDEEPCMYCGDMNPHEWYDIGVCMVCGTKRENEDPPDHSFGGPLPNENSPEVISLMKSSHDSLVGKMRRAIEEKFGEDQSQITIFTQHCIEERLLAVPSISKNNKLALSRTLVYLSNQ